MLNKSNAEVSNNLRREILLGMLSMPVLGMLPLSEADAQTVATASTDALFAGTQFTHPGLLYKEADFTRMRNNIGVEPWASAYVLLQNDLKRYATRLPSADSSLRRYAQLPSGVTNNFGAFQQDISAALAFALNWKITGDTTSAERSISFLDAWAAKLKTIEGDNDSALLPIQFYQISNVAEVVRTYTG
jgi:hypothetical protein